MTSEEKSEAPWTAAEVESLNRFQKSQHFHPFTGVRKPDGQETILIATKDGWVEKDKGPVVQTWAWKWMTDESWREVF